MTIFWSRLPDVLINVTGSLWLLLGPNYGPGDSLTSGVT